MSPRLSALAERPIFTVGAITYSWDDVLAWAEARGTLDELRRRARSGVRLASRPELKDELPQDAVSAAATEFRYERRLLSAEELEAWLARWELTVQEWGEHLERKLLLADSPDDPEAGDLDPPAEAVDEAEYVDAVCSGFLEGGAEGLAADVAIADAAAEELEAERPATIEETIAAAAAARESAKGEAGVEREITRRVLDWTRLDLERVELETEGAAREAALCVRHDGRALVDVAADCRAPVQRISVYVTDLEQSVQPLLLAARAGDLVGPVEEDGGYVLLAVTARTMPSSDDPGIKQRAQTLLVQRAVKRAVEGRVEWHGDL